MNNPYLIAVDLDGTLLRDDKTISKENLFTLQHLQNMGHKVVISTGRPYRSSKQYYAELGLKTPIVNLNGAYIHHPINKNYEAVHHSLPLPKAKDILRACQNIDVHKVMIDVKDDVYLKEHDELFSYFIEEGKHNLYYGDLFETLKHDPSSMLIKCDEKNVDAVQNLLLESHAEDVVFNRWSAPNQILEIMKIGVSKASGLQHLGEQFNIPKERMIAFGDESNDKEMLKYVNHGIAMGNAKEHIKDLADEVTKSNEENGIAHYLQKFFKL